MEDQNLSQSEITERTKGKIQQMPGTLPIEIEIESIKEIKEIPIQWLWKNIIAYGKMTLFAGEPGVGKSQLLLYIASIISQGGKFHFSSSIVQKAKVLLISGEDNADDTLKPRLMALGADLDNIHYVKGIKRLDRHGNAYHDAISLLDHLEELEHKIKAEKYEAIIVDPIALYLGSVDDSNNKEIRSALSRLTALAERNNLALILNSHFTKPTGNIQKNAIYRVMGSIGFAAAARIIFGIMKDPDNPARRLFIPIKNNIGKDDEGYVYEIKSVVVGENKIETCKIEWLNEKITKTANEILNPPLKIDAPKVDEAKEFLSNILKNGAMLLTKIRQESEKNGISVNRLYKAKNELKIIEDEYFEGKKRKIWVLP